MNILVITPWFPNHPEDQYGNFILDSLEALVGLGHKVNVLVTRPYVPGWLAGNRKSGRGRIAAEMFRRGFGLNSLSYFSIPGNFLRLVANELYVAAGYRVARELALRHQVDVIHAHTDVAGYLALRVRDCTGIPVVTTLHGINTHPRYWFGFGQKNFFQVVCRSPDRLVIVGEPLRQFVSRYWPDESHVRIVYNGFRAASASPYRKHRIFGGRTTEFISVSNLVPGKGIDTNLHAFAHLNEKGLSNWHYQIVGGGPERDSLERLAAELRLHDQVSFLGQNDHGRIFSLLGRADIFTLPSSPEAFGVAYLEAMACGLLTIGARGEGPEAFITEGQTGFLVSAHDDLALAGLFAQLMGNRGETARIASAGQTEVWERFTWDVHAAGLLRVFEEAVEGS